jgi:hypothetical protein
MKTTHTGAARVSERFPDDRHAIERLYGQHDEFREMCEHYSECQLVLARFRSSADAKQDRVQEYKDLIEELEQEIRKTLDAAP